MIVDVIWAMANHRTDVDREWLTRGPLVEFGDTHIRVVPPEELIWSKLYVLQKDRSDWPDIFNILHAAGATLDWNHLLARLGEDRALLNAVLTVFRWLAPHRAAELPARLWHLKDGPTPPDDEVNCEHVRLLDTRPWFRPLESGENC